MTVKRSREDTEEIEDKAEDKAAIDLLMLLSRVGETTTSSDSAEATPSGRFFQCKTCNKKFQTFQALGGHRASHKKLKLMAELMTQPSVNDSRRKRKKHQCPICRLQFPMGQALGGHMRRHRAAILEGRRENGEKREEDMVKVVPAAVLKRSNSSKRVFGLDLNLSPFENDLQQVMKTPSLFKAF